MSRLRAPKLIAAFVIIVSTIFLVLTGVSVAETLRIIAVVLIQASAGIFIWRRIHSPFHIAGDIGMGLGLGTAMSVVSGLLVQFIGLGSWGWALPAIVTLAWWVVRKIQLAGPAIGTESRIDSSTALALVVTAVIGFGSLLFNLKNYPLSWVGSWGGYHADMLYFEALSRSIAHFGPQDSIFMSDGIVRYHWLVYAWSGQLTETSHASSFVVLTRVLPLITVLGSSLIAIAWTRRLTKIQWAPSLAVILILIGGYVGATYGTILNFDSPSQSMTVLWLLATSFLFTEWVGRHTDFARSRSTMVLGILTFLTLGFALTGGKVSSGAVIVVATCLAALAGLVFRTAWKFRALFAAIAIIIGAVTAFITIVSGSADPGGLKLFKLLDRASSVQGVNPISGSLGIVLGTIILLIAIAIRWSGVTWLATAKSSRTSVETWLGLGLVSVGLLTVIAVSGGLNDTWFALAASGPLCVLSAVGVARATQAISPDESSLFPRGNILIAFISGLVISIIVYALWLTGSSGGNNWVSSARWLGPITAVLLATIVGYILGRSKRLRGSYRTRWFALTLITLVGISTVGRFTGVGTNLVGSQPGLSSDAFSPITAFVTTRDQTPVTSWTSDQVAAASWVKDHAQDTTLIATNVTLSPLVPALTQQQTFASGLTYQAPYGRPKNLQEVLLRENQSWDFIDRPSSATAEPLCSAGVTLLWVDPKRTSVRDWKPWASVVFRNPDVQILKFQDSTCR